MDNHRFFGHVGWRQDRQTFDGVTFAYQPIEQLSLQYGYITKWNRIFAEDKDVNSKDHLLNASYNTSVGKITGYSYLLEVDNESKNGLDTYGLRFNGSTSIAEQKIAYQLEYATQEPEVAASAYSTDYILAELSSSFSGVGVKVGYELLGSDGGRLRLFNTVSDHA